MGRPYIGYDGTAGSRRAGMERFVVLLTERFPAVWNNGTWVVKEIQGKPGQMSVHASGRAVDLSWRGGAYAGSGRYEDARRVMDFLIEHAYAFRIEQIIDYQPTPGSRAWRCDRESWITLLPGSVVGAPGGDWFHVEIAPEFADDPRHYEQVFARLSDRPSVPFPGVLRRRDRGRMVRKVQRHLGLARTGFFGRRTEHAVSRFQERRSLPVTGRVDRVTWKALMA